MTDLKALRSELDALVDQIGGINDGSIAVWRPKSGKGPSHLGTSCPKLRRAIPRGAYTRTEALGRHLCALCAEVAVSYGVSDEDRLAIGVGTLRLALSHLGFADGSSSILAAERKQWLDKAAKTAEMAQTLAVPELCGFTNELLLAVKALDRANSQALRDDNPAEAVVRFCAAGLAFEVSDLKGSDHVGQLAPTGWSSALSVLGGRHVCEELFRVWIKALSNGNDFADAVRAVQEQRARNSDALPERFDQLPGGTTLDGASFAGPVEWAVAEWRIACDKQVARLTDHWCERSEAALINGTRERTAFVVRQNNKPLSATVSKVLAVFEVASDTKKGIVAVAAPEVVVRWLMLAGNEKRGSTTKVGFHVSHSDPLSVLETELTLGLFEPGDKGPMGQLRTVVMAAKALAP